MQRTRILLVTGIESPFWIEFASQVNASAQVQLHVLFTDPTLEDRGTHWRAMDRGSSMSTVRRPQDQLESWLAEQFRANEPDVVVCGGIKTRGAKLAYQLARASKLLVGIFGEQPSPVSAPLRALRDLQYRFLLRRFTPDFILAVGDRAVDIYTRLAPRDVRTFFFPYHQALHYRSVEQAPRADNRVRFLFSGRLLERNSIKEMVAAFRRLAEEQPGRFTWCISADGPEEYRIRQACEESAAFREAVFFDREFANWDDRLRPFANADVLLVPAKHSGWGLVVPESLATGVPVIAGRQVEAARYYIHDFVNGMLIDPTEEGIYGALTYVLGNRDQVDRMKQYCHPAAGYGDAAAGAVRLQGIISYMQHILRGSQHQRRHAAAHD